MQFISPSISHFNLARLARSRGAPDFDMGASRLTPSPSRTRPPPPALYGNHRRLAHAEPGAPRHSALLQTRGITSSSSPLRTRYPTQFTRALDLDMAAVASSTGVPTSVGEQDALKALTFQRLHPKTYLERFLAENVRPDGREFDEWRDISVNVGSCCSSVVREAAYSRGRWR